MTAFLLLCACLGVSSAAVMLGQINGELCFFIDFDTDSAITVRRPEKVWYTELLLYRTS